MPNYRENRVGHGNSAAAVKQALGIITILKNMAIFHPESTVSITSASTFELERELSDFKLKE